MYLEELQTICIATQLITKKNHMCLCIQYAPGQDLCHGVVLVFQLMNMP